MTAEEFARKLIVVKHGHATLTGEAGLYFQGERAESEQAERFRETIEVVTSSLAPILREAIDDAFRQALVVEEPKRRAINPVEDVLSYEIDRLREVLLYYRNLAAALAREQGVSELLEQARRQGIRQGIIEGKERAVKAVRDLDDIDGGDSLYTQAADSVSVEP